MTINVVSPCADNSAFIATVTTDAGSPKGVMQTWTRTSRASWKAKCATTLTGGPLDTADARTRKLLDVLEQVCDAARDAMNLETAS